MRRQGISTTTAEGHGYEVVVHSPAIYTTGATGTTGEIGTTVTTGDDSSEVSTARRWKRLIPNGWEVALWVFGIVLVWASVQANVLGVQRIYFSSSSYSCDATGSCVPASMIYLQAALTLSPAGLAAGLICLGLALALRANDGMARRQIRSATEVDAPRVQEADRAAARSVATFTSGNSVISTHQPTPDRSSAVRSDADLSAFMRPTDTEFR